MKNQKGFSLVEIIIAMAVTTIMLAGLANFFVSQAKTTSMQVMTIDTIASARTTLATMTREIRMAGFRPSKAVAAGVAQANATSIRVTMDLNQDNTVSGGDEDVTYSFVNNDGNKMITRNGVLMSNVDNVSFTYTLSDGSTTQTPADLTAIRRITLVLTVRSNTIDPLTQTYRLVELNSDITPRNLAL